MTPERFRAAFDAVERHIERRYGIPVVISDVADPFTGDLDGAEIRLDYDQDAESALFLVAHLFGHTVQFNLSERHRELGTIRVENPSAELLAELELYERDACRLALTLFRDAGVHDLDQWLSDFAACDFAYLLHFYTTGEKRAFRSFWRDGAPALTPLAIPQFEPRAWRSRWDGVVV